MSPRDAFAPTTPYDLRQISDAETIAAPSSLPEPASHIAALAAERYTARGVLGAGGMGEVLLSKDQWIGRDVALKTLLPEVAASGGGRARFLREIRVQGQLEHPAIVPVYDVGTRSDGSVYFTMRRIKGRTLSDVLVAVANGDKETALHYSRRKLLTAFSSIAMVAHYAHTRGVVHRDLKPSNVMLGDFGEVYVLDWGIAKLVGVEDGPDVISAGEESTGSGRVIGTLGYMAPEQARGGAIDARTDVYALGVILFEILSGENLVQDTNAMRALEAILAGMDARPSRRRPDAQIPPELDAICARATALDPADRFADARALSEAIEGFLDGDRDLERRRDIAREYLASAEKTRAASSDPHQARIAAVRDTLRAVALAPEEPEPVAALAKLVLEPPSGMPEAAKAERDAHERDARIQGAVLGYRAFLSFTLSFPLMVLAGIRSWALVLGGMAVVLMAAFVARVAVEKRNVGTPVFVGLLALTSIVVLVQATWLGPFVLMPVAATIGMAVFSLYAQRHERLWVLATGAVLAAIPFLTELVPGIPKAYTFTEGGVLLHPRALELTPVATTIGLLYTTVGYILLPSIFLGRLKDSLRVAEERVFLQAWTLKQLLPKS